MDREQLISKIVKEMSLFSERVKGYSLSGIGLRFQTECPASFKAGTSDKMLFRKIVEERWEDVRKSWYEEGFNSKFIGVGLMIQFYYPLYGDFDKEQREHK